MIILPYTAEQHDILSHASIDWLIAQIVYTGIFSYELPDHCLIKFICLHPLIFRYRTKSDPLLPPTALVFSDVFGSGQAVSLITG